MTKQLPGILLIFTALPVAVLFGLSLEYAQLGKLAVALIPMLQAMIQIVAGLYLCSEADND